MILTQNCPDRGNTIHVDPTSVQWCQWHCWSNLGPEIGPAIMMTLTKLRQLMLTQILFRDQINNVRVDPNIGRDLDNNVDPNGNQAKRLTQKISRDLVNSVDVSQQYQCWIDRNPEFGDSNVVFRWGKERWCWAKLYFEIGTTLSPEAWANDNQTLWPNIVQRSGRTLSMLIQSSCNCWHDLSLEIGQIMLIGPAMLDIQMNIAIFLICIWAKIS